MISTIMQNNKLYGGGNIMKKSKSVIILSIVLMITMMLNSLSFAAAKEAQQEEKNAEAVEFLEALGILQGDLLKGFNAEDTITRAEFAEMVVRMMGFDEKSAQKQETRFSDVPADHKQSGYIKLASDINMINGYGDGTFGPDDPVEYAQAIKLFVHALGYDLLAEQKGGYPAGYLMIAAELGIARGVKMAASESLTKGVAAQLVYNSLDIDIMQQSGFGDSIEYVVERDKTILTEKFEVEKVEGILNATYLTRINSGPELKEDEVEIDSVKYKVGKTNAEAFLGYNVVAYVKEIDKEQVIIYIKEDKGNNNVLVVEADDIVSVSGVGTRNGEFEYYKDKDDDETKIADLSVNINVIYNGKSLKANDRFDGTTVKPVEDFLKPASGKVVLIDNDDDDKYDIAMVTSYEIYYVSSVANYKISDKNGAYKTLSIDPDDKSLKIAVYKDGKKISVDDIAVNDVLSVARSINKTGDKIINIYVSNNTVSGKVEEITEEGNDYKVYIEGTEYDVIDELVAMGKEPKIDDEGTFYLDVDGRIAGFDKGSTNNQNYAYIIKIAKSKGVNDSYQFKVLNKNGEIVVLEAKDEIEFDSNGDYDHAERMKTEYVVENFLKYTDSKTQDPTRLVIMETNSENKITKLVLPASGVKDNNKFDYYVEQSNIKGRRGQMFVNDSEVMVSAPGAMVFKIPSDFNNENDFYVGPLVFSDYLNDKGFGDKIALFDVSPTNRIGLILHYLPADGGNWLDTVADNAMFPLVKTTTFVDDESEKFTRLYYNTSGIEAYVDAVDNYKVQRRFTESDIRNSYTIKKGDVGIIGKNSKGQMNVVSIVFSVDEYLEQRNANPDFYNDPEELLDCMTYFGDFINRSSVVFGRVTDYDTDTQVTLAVTTQDGNNNKKTWAVSMTPGTQITKINPNTGKISYATIDEAPVKGTPVLARFNLGSLKEVIMLEDVQ